MEIQKTKEIKSITGSSEMMKSFDERLTVVGKGGWAALLVLGLLVLGVVIWGFVGRIEKYVVSQGVLTYGAGIIDVSAGATGMITDISAQPGEVVEMGQVLGRIDTPDIVQEIITAQDQLTSLGNMSVESIALDPQIRNGDIYPEFAQIIQQIESYEAQSYAAGLGYNKNLDDYQNQIEQKQLELDGYRDQRSDATDRYDDYIDINGRNEQTVPQEGSIYVDQLGTQYSRSYRAENTTVVYDYNGRAYSVLSSAGSDEQLPVYYFIDTDGDGSPDLPEIENTLGQYYLPSYFTNTGGGTSSVPTSNVPTIFYDSQTGRMYLDPQGLEFAPIEYRTLTIYDSNLDAMIQQIEQYNLQITQAEAELELLKQTATDYLQGEMLQNQALTQLLKAQFEAAKLVKQNDLLQQISTLQDELMRKSSIVSPVEGRVLELNFRTGTPIEEGGTYCSIVRSSGTSSDNQVVLYVSVEDGKKIQQGMTVQVTPATVDKNQYGHIVGLVKSVSEYVVSEEHMTQTLNNELLMQSLTQDSAPLEVTVELLRSTDTISGYKWSMGSGAPITIDPGTICQAEIVVESMRPAEMVLPYIKKLLSN